MIGQNKITQDHFPQQELLQKHRNPIIIVITKD